MDHPNMNSRSINCNSPAILPLTMFSSPLTAGHEEASTSTTFVKQPAARKKRTKFLHANSQAAGGISKPTRKPDPAAPKITRPCTECGKKFWSWKALFGHMRCHPERQWRGINPPPSLQQRRPNSEDSSAVTEEDHEVANCLLLLASGATRCDHVDQDSPSTARTPLLEYCNCDYHQYYNLAAVGFNVDNNVITSGNAANCREFECSSCKKVFGSHQALGGHRASHKNVKGCYAITKNIDEQEYCSPGGDNGTASITNHVNHHDNEILVTPAAGGHQCSICMRIFSSGQALGGHKRCHWEKTSIEDQEGEIFAADGFDLNFPAAVDKDDHAASSYSSIDSSFRNPNNLDLSLRL